MTQSSLFTRLLCTGAVGLFGLTAFGGDQTPAARSPGAQLSDNPISTQNRLGVKQVQPAGKGKLAGHSTAASLSGGNGPGPRDVNDNCADAIQINCGDTISGNTAGNTTDFVWPCAAGGNEQWYTVVASGTTLVVDLCGSSYDTAVMVLDSCGGPVRGCNDDFCGLQSQLTVGGLTVGTTYWIAVGGYNGATGSFTMTVTCGTPPPCDAADPQPGDVEEGEPFGGCDTGYVDAFNGGCNSVPPAFSPLTCGQTVHGESGTFLSGTGAQYRDTDWYQFEVTGTGAIVTWSATADFPALIGILREGCPTGGFLVFATAPTCTPVSVVSACLPPGNYYAFIAPSTFSGVACGSDYRATLDCVTCEPPPSCALPQPGDIEEAEPFGGCETDYADAFNGGCNSIPPVFSPIDCGDTVHGESGTFPAFGFQYRDTDWYEFEVTGTGAIVTWSATADFPVLIGILPGVCPTPGFLVAATAEACTPVSVVSACLPAGNYYAFIAPSGFTGVPCGSQYRATLDCVTCEPPPPPVNNDCAGAIQINCGDTITGDTTNATTDGGWICAGGGSDVWYSFVAGDSVAIISLCGSSYDTALMVLDGCSGTVLGCNDDSSCGLQSQLTVSGLTVGQPYLIAVGGYAANQGAYTLNLTCGIPPCEGSDPQPGDIEEGEPFGGCETDYADAFNGGCNSIPPVFSPLTCGDTVHGESGTFPAFGFQYRDTDWYQFEVTGSGAIVTWSATAAFPALIGILPEVCPTTGFLVAATAPACTAVSVVSACLPPGNYYAFIAPSDFTGVPCGSQYRATLDCLTCEPPLPPPDNCADAQRIQCGDNITGTTTGLTTDGVWPCAAGGSDGWYEFIATGTDVTIDLCGSSYDTAVMLLDGCGGNVLGCNDDFCGLQSTLTVGGLTVGNTYLIAVGGYSGAQGAFTMTLTGCPATCVGDLDNDGDRDITDLAILLSQFGSTGGTYAGDIDGDGDVDIGDLAQLLSVFGVPC